MIGYDTLYAIQDIEDDELVGVKSSARALGEKAQLGVGICYALALAGWAAAIWSVRPDWVALLALLPAAVHLARQVARIDPKDGAGALALFRSNRFTGLLLFLGFLVGRLVVGRLTRLGRAAMLEPAAARDQAASLVELARKKGADAADAVYVGERSQGVSVRLGALEDVHRSEGEEIGLRVFVGKRNATVASSDLSDGCAGDAGRARAGDGRRSARGPISPALRPEELLFRGTPADLDLDDGGDPDPAELKERALAAEDAARAVEGVTNSGGAGASASASTFAIATSHGFAGATRATGYSNSASVVAGEGAAMQRDYAWHSARHLADLEAAGGDRRSGCRGAPWPGSIRSASRRASCRCCSIRASRPPCSAISSRAISGSAIARQASFLLDALGNAGIRARRDDPRRSVPQARPSQPRIRWRRACR